MWADELDGRDSSQTASTINIEFNQAIITEVDPVFKRMAIGQMAICFFLR